MPNSRSRARERFARCTEFTTDHGLSSVTDEDGVFGAAICPECAKENPLTGTPAEFAGQVVRCMACTRVMILDAGAIVAFKAEVADDDD